VARDGASNPLIKAQNQNSKHHKMTNNIKAYFKGDVFYDVPCYDQYGGRKEYIDVLVAELGLTRVGAKMSNDGYEWVRRGNEFQIRSDGSFGCSPIYLRVTQQIVDITIKDCGDMNCGYAFEWLMDPQHKDEALTWIRTHMRVGKTPVCSTANI
jgi:hypothetical protein